MSSEDDYIFDLRDELDREAQRYSNAADKATVLTGSDESGAIGVEYDPESLKLTVSIEDKWRSSYEPSSLGAGIVTAVAALGAERMQQWTEGVAETEDEPAPRTRPLPSSSDTLVSHMQSTIDSAGDSINMDSVFNDLMTMLEEVNAGLEATMEIVTARASMAHAGASGSGSVTATIDGSGSLTSLAYDEDWLAQRSAYEITTETNQAIAAAARIAASAETANILVGTPLEKYGSVISDPQAFARTLLGRD